jgi:predicted 3-demethylubiquinone-9 3-methyltransferase (glyoxalase superfamily)
MVVMFELNGKKFMGLNGGPQFKFDEAVSFVVNCDTQDEIDYYWEKLTSNGGQESMCGWLKDQFGLSWQIIPSMLGELMTDPEKSQRVMQEIMKMKKLDLEKLKNA